MPVTFSDFAGHGENGMSLPEIVITITVIGVLAAVMIPTMSGVFANTRASVAETNLEMLNRAVLKYNQANTNYSSQPDASADDEIAIFQMLQVKDANVLGSPFIRSTMTVTPSNAPGSHRAVWNGRMFQMADTDSGDEGLDLLEMK